MFGLETLGGGAAGGMTALVVLKGVETVSAATKKAEGSLQKLTTAVGVAGGIMAGFGLMAAASLSRIGAESLQTKRAYEIMAKDMGAASKLLLSDLKKLSGGTIAETQLMLEANKAMIAKIPIENIKKMMQIARASATATGASVTAAFQSLVGGVAKMETELLKSVGIIVRADEVYKDYAKTLGKTTAELTTAEKGFAFLNKTMEEGEEIIRKVGAAGSMITEMEVFQQMTAAIDDLKSAIGEALIPVVLPFIEILKNIVNVLKQHPDLIATVIHWLIILGTTALAAKGFIAGMNAVMSMSPPMLIAMAVAIPIVIIAMKKLKDAFDDTGTAITDSIEGANELMRTYQTMGETQLGAAIETMEAHLKVLEDNNVAFEQASDALQNMKDRLSDMSSGASESVKEVSLLENAISNLTNKIKEMGSAEMNVKKRMEDTLGAIINQEEKTKEKWQTTEEFGEELRQLGISEEYVRKAMEQGSIQLSTQEDLIAALGNTWLQYVNAMREAHAANALVAQGMMMPLTMENIGTLGGTITGAGGAVSAAAVMPDTRGGEKYNKQLQLQNQLLAENIKLQKERNNMVSSGDQYERNLALTLDRERRARSGA